MAGQIVKRGERKYLLRIYLGRDDSTGKRKYINKTVNGSKRDAEAELTRLLRERDTGTLIHFSKESLNSYLDRWLETVAKPRVRIKTLDDYRAQLRIYIRPELGETQLQRLHATDIQAVYAAMLERGLSARTVRYAHSVLRDALEQAVKWRLIQANPADYVDLPRQERQEMQCMTEEEAHRFLEAARLSKHHTLFALMLATGLRPSEALGLKWQDFDFKAHLLRVQRKLTRRKGGYTFDEPKTKRARRTVDYPLSLTDLLLQHRAHQAELNGNSDLVFTGDTGQPLDERNLLHRHFRPLLLKAELSVALRLYDLRHTHATLLLIAGVNPKVVSERLGHSSVAITLDTYSHVLPSLQKETASRLEAMLFSDMTEGNPRGAARPEAHPLN